MKKIVLALITLVITGCSEADNKPLITGKEGEPISNFNIQLTDGIHSFNARQLAKGHNTVLFYFSPYCAYSRMVTKRIINNIDEIKNTNFIMLSGYPIVQIKEFETKFKLQKYKNIIIGNDSASTFLKHFKFQQLPFFAIYDANNILKRAYLGPITTKQLKQIKNL